MSIASQASTVGEPITLADGRLARLRHASAQDAGRLLALFETVIPKAPSLLAHQRRLCRAPSATQPSAVFERACLLLVTGEGSAETVVASAAYLRRARSDTVELAIAIAGDSDYPALETQLLRAVLQLAQSHGAQRWIYGAPLNTRGAPTVKPPQAGGDTPAPTQPIPTPRRVEPLHPLGASLNALLRAGHALASLAVLRCARATPN